eukprot:c6044_g1_i1.p1 GENE.c6044_g1_i1~~c6044_g1_i1.p1  ORF type:complete len:294 (-),score=79.75 c6044_g1_i1:165-974(-)
MFNAAVHAEALRTSRSYGFDVSVPPVDWRGLVTRRQEFIGRLNKVYLNNLNSSKVDVLSGYGKLIGSRTVSVNNEVITAPHIVLAVGGTPTAAPFPGAEHTINSDQFFDIKELPSKVAIVGAGYIAVELAGFLKELGAKTEMFIRGEKVLRHFDQLVRDTITSEYERSGIIVHRNSRIESVSRHNTLTVKTSTNTFEGFDHVIVAIGRRPLTDGIGLEESGVTLNDRRAIVVEMWMKLFKALPLRCAWVPPKVISMPVLRSIQRLQRNS